MTLKITGISSRAAGEEICVTFEISGENESQKQRESFLISARQYLVLCPQRGECDTDMYDAISRASEVFAALKRGTAILSCGACSEKALCTKLRAKGFEREVAESAVSELLSLGLINANSDAYREAQRQAAKLWGERRITSELYAKGYSQEAISAAMSALEDGGIDYAENCRALIKKRYKDVPADSVQRQKMIAALIRYGYSMSQIKEALSAKKP